MTYSPASVRTYAQVNIETASQGKLIIMLFNGAIRRAEEAIHEMDKKNTEAVHAHLIRAQEIIAELRSALNMEAGGEIARNLDRIYEYFQHLLITANLKKDPAPAREAITLMKEMRDTWQELFDHISREGAETANPPTQPAGAMSDRVNIAG
jgi:flagellar protein FliS